MFITSIDFFSSDEQRAKWMPGAKSLKITGCYAQTELGHGSNVQGLETTFTLDMETDEWVIHTPNSTATKFWPGSLGISANHAVVYGRCIANGNDYGVKPFFVQIRDFEKHMPLKGVEVGDLGPKLGYNCMENGYLSFDHVRCPRTNLMERFGKVTKEGDFEMNGDPRILYNIMVITRTNIIRDSSVSLKIALVVATRYAVCRRQFKTLPDSPDQERKLIDYQTHMQIIGTNLANYLVFALLAQRIKTLSIESNKLAKEKNSFKLIHILHHLTAGFKSMVTQYTYKGIDELR
jgi:acyl-CoA oxidase